MIQTRVDSALRDWRRGLGRCRMPEASPAGSRVVRESRVRDDRTPGQAGKRPHSGAYPGRDASGVGSLPDRKEADTASNSGERPPRWHTSGMRRLRALSRHFQGSVRSKLTNTPWLPAAIPPGSGNRGDLKGERRGGEDSRALGPPSAVVEGSSASFTSIHPANIPRPDAPAGGPAALPFSKKTGRWVFPGRFRSPT